MDKKFKQRADGLENVFSKKGTSRSKTGGNRFVGSDLLDYETLSAIYESGGIGAKGLTRVADDITRKGFSITNYPKAQELLDTFDDLNGSTLMNEAIRWARTYGGSLLCIIAKDGGKLISPMNTKKPVEVERLEVYEAGCSRVVRVDKYYNDSRRVQYGLPEIYEIQSGDGTNFKIHESRCIRFKGRPLDSLSKTLNEGWDSSELQPVYNDLLLMMSQNVSGEEVLNEMVIGTLKLENLDAMCVDSEGEDHLRKRLDLVDISKSNENTVAIDVNEEYERHTVNLSGVSNIQHNAMNVVAGAFDIPATVLFGVSPSGQNATGDSDMEQYYGKIEAERKYRYAPALRKLFKIIAGVRVSIEFPSMRVSNLFDTSRSAESFGKALKDLVDSGILTAQEAKLQWESSKLTQKIAVLE
jgi:hypothetical protein